jgi:hypothetical protein
VSSRSELGRRRDAGVVTVTIGNPSIQRLSRHRSEEENHRPLEYIVGITVSHTLEVSLDRCLGNDPVELNRAYDSVSRHSNITQGTAERGQMRPITRIRVWSDGVSRWHGV